MSDHTIGGFDVQMPIEIDQPALDLFGQDRSSILQREYDGFVEPIALSTFFIEHEIDTIA